MRCAENFQSWLTWRGKACQVVASMTFVLSRRNHLAPITVAGTPNSQLTIVIGELMQARFLKAKPAHISGALVRYSSMWIELTGQQSAFS
jgi:hypothetical protein